ncbi:MAG: translation initiation factor IF-3 [Deltaproteobacteria bacterium]|nr:translation initiation factor IF-3 [Deltaproteobacteria bacterium]MBI2974611.1 translation initiation factor IF-3 [Deltaproteobacteria bacterium]
MRVNFRIRVPEVRVIGPDGGQMGLFQTRDALKRAQEFGLDLVEISPTARPPVCKIMDYGKYKYEIAKREQAAKKHQIVIRLKEIRLRPATDDHDVQTKVRHIKRFLEEGDKVKVTVQFRGREMAHKEMGEKLVAKITSELGAMSQFEQQPKFEGRALSMILVSAKTK